MSQGSSALKFSDFFSSFLPTLPTQPGFQVWGLAVSCHHSWAPSAEGWLCSTISWLTAGSCFPLTGLQLLRFQLAVPQVYLHRASALTAVQQALPESIHFLPLHHSEKQREKQCTKPIAQVLKQNHNFDTQRKTATTYLWGCIMDF